MLPADVKPISVDDHVIEPPHLWQSRLLEDMDLDGIWAQVNFPISAASPATGSWSAWNPSSTLLPP